MRVLIVEDDEGVRDRLSSWLERELRHEVMEAGTVAEALPQIQQADALVLDLYLPNGQGTEVLREVARTRDDLPVIFSTLFPDAAATVAPLVECLPKPYTLLELRDALDRAARTWNAIEKLRSVAAAL